MTRLTPAGFEADVSSETLSRTTLGTAEIGAQLNLERSLTLSGRLGGHLVSGHVDGVGTLLARRTAGPVLALTFGFPPSLARFIAEKGSIAVNGVSLTVNAVTNRSFDVMIIPHTADVTSIGALAEHDAVNLEVDLLARYVARLLERPGAEPESHTKENAAWMDRLKESGML